MRTTFGAVFGLSLVALIASPAFAQQGRGFGMMGGSYAMLIGNEGVQKELKLDDSQTEKAKEFAEKAMEEMRGVREKLQGLEGDELRTKRQEIMKEMNDSAMKAVGAFLKPEQIHRLKQISIQAQGIRAFADADVAKKLNLTDSQKSDIRAVSEETMEELRGVPFGQDQSDEERTANMKKRAEINKAAMGKVAAKLNDEQQKAWKELIGSPFEVQYQRRSN